jgi:CRISPR-associated endonuclease/helicase Cas3
VFFPPAGENLSSLADYGGRSLEQAHKALDALGWDAWQPDGRSVEFGELFPDIAPNRLQQQAIALADAMPGAACVIIEAPMGLGKTEAALYLADRLLTANQHTGIYYALPTQATSNAMFQRFKAYVERRHAGHPNLHLLHGMAAFDDSYEALTEATRHAQPCGVWDEERDGAVIAASWFRQAKLGLLSPFAVGTIDQALFGALQTRHQFVRLYGLAGKVVILDEVHAYDTYTTCLIERLLSWLKVLGCSVILLSATLPRAKRESLLDAWGSPAVSDWGAYPRLTVATVAGARAVPVPAEPRPAVRLAPLPQTGEWHQVVRDRLADRLAGGGCAAWLCNTVGRAQEAYLRLKADPRFNGGDTELLLFHARYPVFWRAQREAEVLAKFGKHGARPRRAILVATQVIEQSLDLDFDLMISDPAPIDLLLQRAGRVHRHIERSRPPQLDSPTLEFLAPTCYEQVFEHFKQSASVYEPWLLLRTWLALRGGSEEAGAADIERLVERVYGGEAMAVPEGLRAEAGQAEHRLADAAAQHQHWARRNCLRSPDDRVDPFRRTVGLDVPDDDQTGQGRIPSAALTRLGDESIMVVCACGATASELYLADGLSVPTRGQLADESGKRLVGYSVRVADRGLLDQFKASAPANWSKSAVLRNYGLAVFDGEYCVAGGRRLRLRSDLGLVLRPEVQEMMG